MFKKLPQNAKSRSKQIKFYNLTDQLKIKKKNTQFIVQDYGTFKLGFCKITNRMNVSN